MKTEHSNLMKQLLVLTLLGWLAIQHLALAQDPPKPTALKANPPAPPPPPPPPGPPLPKFDLDFGGGQPAALVEFIEKAIGKRLNVIVPDEYRDTQIPELKMKGVTVPQLFDALEQASRKQVRYVTGTFSTAGGTQAQYQTLKVSYGFKTTGVPREDSIWYFFREEPPEAPTVQPELKAPKLCRFYHLGRYLETYKIEDITTAIETGWKMLGEKQLPDLKFHKDTQLLIAVGEPDKLSLIDAVLRQLTEASVVRGSKPDKAKVEPAKQ